MERIRRNSKEMDPLDIISSYQVPGPKLGSIKYRIRLVRRRKATGEHTFEITRMGITYGFIHWDSINSKFRCNDYEKTYF